MNLIAEYFLRVTVVLMLAFAVTRMLRRQPAALRHVLWACAFGIAAATPLFLQFGPRIEIEHPAPVITLQTESISNTAGQLSLAPSPPKPSRVPSVPLLEILWLTGALAFGIRLWNASRRTRALLKHVNVLEIPAPQSIRIAESDAVATAMTIGAFRPWILLPPEHRGWEPEFLRAVLVHEVAHVRRRDCLLQWLPNLVCAVHWFNPLVWLARSEMVCESERACDDAVIRSGISGSAFARDLVDIVQSLRLKGNTLMSSALTTKLERRIRRLVDPAADRRPLTVARALLSACAALVLLSPVAGVRAEQVLKAPLAVSLPKATESIAAPNPLAAPKKAPRLLAQVATQPAQLPPAGSLSGVVRDPTGAVVQNATVSVQFLDAGGRAPGGGRGGAAPVAYSTVTDATGQWSFSSLASGGYDLEIQVPGFASFKKFVTVGPALNARADANLALGRTLESVTVSAERPNTYSLTFPTTGQSSPRPIKVGGMVEPPKRMRIVTPAFPQTARERGVQGSITFTAIINKSGFIQDTPLTASNAPPELIQAAFDAVKQWQYTPALLNGEPVDFLTEITVNFTLQ